MFFNLGLLVVLNKFNIKVLSRIPEKSVLLRLPSIFSFLLAWYGLPRFLLPLLLLLSFSGQPIYVSLLEHIDCPRVRPVALIPI